MHSHLLPIALIAAGAAAAVSPPPHLHAAVARSRGSPNVDAFTYLDNGVVRLGVDLSRGGTIGWLGPSSNTSFNLLNVHDYGRSVQGSFYSGPAVFNPDGKCSEPGGWGKPWPWNPIGSGDVYLHAAPIINYTIAPDNSSAVVWTTPLQWACDQVPCDCTFQQVISLVGNAVEVQLTMHTARVDKTFYPGQTQELPAVYVIGDFCHLWTYNGSAPFTGDALAEQPAVWGVNAWDAFTSGERWMAFTNSSGYGVGVVAPGVAHFGAGFFDNGKIGTYNCVPKGLGPYDSPTGYIAPWSSEIIDPDAPFAYNFSLVLGSLESIRAYASAAHAAGRDEPLAPSYDFVARGDRAHCVYLNAQDGGLPVPEAGIAFNVTGPHPSVFGPLSVFPSASVSRVIVNASFDATLAGSHASLAWEPLGAGSPCPACYVDVPVVADGATHSIVFDVTSAPSWVGALERVIFQPLGAAPVDPAVYYRPNLIRISSIMAQ